jgi:predicted methyltransferase
MKQPENPDIKLVDEDGEITLYIAGAQAMQAWEEELMHKSADLLCEYGDTFLEIGLGLGLSALRVAANPGTKSHIVVEKYQRVIDLFIERQPGPLPEPLKIVRADAFEYVETLEQGSLDGIFFDPELPFGTYDDPEVVDGLLPRLFQALRPGGAFIPFFSVEPVLKDRYFRFFNKVLLIKHPFKTYANTNYTHGIIEGDAFIQCFVKDS